MRPDATAERAGAVVCLIGLLVAALSLVLAAIAGPPYLGVEGINGWMIVFVAALLAALIAIPFALEARLRGSYSDSDARWDRAIPIWGGIALVVTVVGALIGVALVVALYPDAVETADEVVLPHPTVSRPTQN